MKKAKASEYFPKNYVESRQRFLLDSQKIPSIGETGSWKIHSKIDPDLTVDYAFYPPLKSPKTLAVLISGIHGSETYTASAILNLFMEEILPGVNRDHLGILVVHAMNPYGFKYHQRCTENQVNLNRNFSVSGEIFKIKNPASASMHDRFHSRTPVSSLQGKLLQNLRRENGKIYFGDTSVDQITKAIAPGQFEHPEHVEYGGKETEPQTKALIALINRLMPQYQDVIGLDLHTGLGHRGRLHLLTDGGKTLNKELFNQILKPEQDKEFYEFTPPETEGFYQVHGATNNMFGELTQAHQRVCAITLEFGTLGHSLDQQVQDMNSFMTEHQGHIFGYANEEIKKQVRDANFERSYPNDEKWRTDVLKAAEGFLTRVFQRI
jgi:predicted deacylase